VNFEIFFKRNGFATREKGGGNADGEKTEKINLGTGRGPQRGKKQKKRRETGSARRRTPKRLVGRGRKRGNAPRMQCKSRKE